VNPLTRTLAIVFAVIGLAASVAAAYIHSRLLVDPAYASFCDVSATVSCTQVYASRYGSFAGISVAVFGAIFFAFATLLTVAAVAGPPSLRESAPAYLFAASTLALAVVLYLGYASLVILNLVCVLCVVTYAAVIALFVLSGAATSVPMTSLPRRAARDLKTLTASPVAIALMLLFVVGAASTLAFFPRETVPAGGADTTAGADTDQGREAEFVRYYEAQPRVSLAVPAEGAKVLVVKFNDYQCPPCRQSHMDYKSVFAKYEASQPGAVRLVLKDFPLEAECNSSVTSSMHAAGCEAAVAVRLARPLGRAEPLEEWLFQNQSNMTPDLVRQGVREVGRLSDFDTRYASTLEAVKSDIAYGLQLGVRSTPTFFINGVKIEGALPSVYFDQAIAYELKRAAAQ
jgi:uncharacterized membrane protein/protein-disulfide isomerase